MICLPLWQSFPVFLNIFAKFLQLLFLMGLEDDGFGKDESLLTLIADCDEYVVLAWLKVKLLLCELVFFRVGVLILLARHTF